MAKQSKTAPATVRPTSPPSQTSTLLSAGIQIINSADIASIFTLFLKPFLHTFLEHTGRYFMFPLNALLDLVEAGLAWYDAYKAHPSARTRALVRAGVATAFGLAILATVLVALTVAAAAPFIPYIFAGALGAKALYHGGASLYFGIKGLSGSDPHQAATYQKLSKQHAGFALSGALATFAVLTVMAFANFKLAPIGIAAGTIGIGLGVKRGYDSIKAILKRREDRLADNANAPAPAARLTQGAGIYRRLSKGEPHWTKYGVAKPLPATIAVKIGGSEEQLLSKTDRPTTPAPEETSGARTSPLRKAS